MYQSVHNSTPTVLHKISPIKSQHEPVSLLPTNGVQLTCQSTTDKTTNQIHEEQILFRFTTSRESLQKNHPNQMNTLHVKTHEMPRLIGLNSPQIEAVKGWQNLN